MNHRLLHDFRVWGFDARAWRPSTRRAYTLRVEAADRWLREHADTTVVRATTKPVFAWMSTLGTSARNRNHARKALNAFYTFLIWRGSRANNPCDEIPVLREPKLVPKALPPEDVQAVVEEARDRDPMYTAAVSLLLFNAMRISEVADLEWARIDRHTITFEGKGGQERLLALAPQAREALDAWRPHCDHARWVFPSPRGFDQPVHTQTIRRHVKDIGEAAGVPEVRPHRLRHSTATQLLRQGVPVSVVQDVLGHASLSTTQMYLRVWRPEVSEALEQLSFDGHDDAGTAAA